MTWDNLAAGLAGAILAFLFNWLIHWNNHRRSINDQQRVAAMEVATQLRKWLMSAFAIVNDISLHNETEGAMGRDHTKIPDFPFEAALSRVATLGPDLAAEVFDLIHSRDEVIRDISHAYEFHDEFEAREEFRTGVAKLYLKAVPIYRDVARQGELTDFQFPANEVDFMKGESVNRFAPVVGGGTKTVV